MLGVGDGQRVGYDVCGRPEGKPAVVLHGGPGSGCTPWWRRLFDLDGYRVVLPDQRGCGRSTPHAGEPVADLTANTTEHLIGDLERLREHLGFERWLVLGGSWGSTLALAYVQRHPERVTELVLFSVVTTSRREVEWMTRGLGDRFPAAWARFRAGVPSGRRDADLAAAYGDLLADPDPAVHEEAARAWCAWEDAVAGCPDPRYRDARFRLGFARLVTHYWRHAGFLADGALLDGIPRIADTPAVLVQGARDAGAPLGIPQALTARWPSAELIELPDAGHGAGTDMTAALMAATCRFLPGDTPRR